MGTDGEISWDFWCPKDKKVSELNFCCMVVGYTFPLIYSFLLQSKSWFITLTHEQHFDRILLTLLPIRRPTLESACWDPCSCHWKTFYILFLKVVKGVDPSSSRFNVPRYRGSGARGGPLWLETCPFWHILIRRSKTWPVAACCSRVHIYLFSRYTTGIIVHSWIAWSCDGVHLSDYFLCLASDILQQRQLTERIVPNQRATSLKAQLLHAKFDFPSRSWWSKKKLLTEAPTFVVVFVAF